MSQTITQHPALSRLWDRAKNADDPAKLLVTSYKTVWWLCDKGHSFQRKPHVFVRDPACPQCKVSSVGGSLAELKPALRAIWHREKNGALSLDTVDAASTAPCWWRCTEGHEFQRPPLQMLRDSSCPTCALAKSSLAVTHPAIAAEWNVERNEGVTPSTVDADHVMTAWWLCAQGHNFQATVRSRTKSNARCPVCFAGWSVEHIREFVQSLIEHINAFDPSEMFALAMQGGLLRDDSKPFVRALTGGKLPREELEKFARGEPSLVDDVLKKKPVVDNNGAPLVLQPDATSPAKPEKPLDPFALPGAPAPTDGVTIDVGVEQDVHGSPAPKEDSSLPVVTAKEALEALESPLVASADAETVKFLLDSAKAKLWRHAYKNPEEARAHAANFKGDVYSTLVRDRFIAEFDAAQSLELPKGYSFRFDEKGPIVAPNLMQRRVAVSLKDSRRFGNWSGMGAGKTLSAILSTRVTDANLTVICCPNAVVANWEREIKKAFPASEVRTKTWTPAWGDQAAPHYLVLNYEQFQQPDSEEKLVAFLAQNTVDFIVIDEIHYAKQRDAGDLMSKRKRLVQGLVIESGKKNADLCVLGMSGTPVINTLQEGKSLVEMITGHRHDDLDVSPTVQNCMRLYQRLVTLGTRWRPEYEIQLDVKRIEIDCAAELDDIRAVSAGTTLDLEKVLTRLRLPTILENIQRGEKVLIYTHFVKDIAKELYDAVRAAGHAVGMLTGETDDDEDLKAFLEKNGRVDVLIASSRIGTGVDGLQRVCRKLIINCLPWTNAEYEQLVGRLYRQGSQFDHVEVIIPVTYANVNGERWSYCESKLSRIDYKKSIADAAVDGVVPDGNLRTPTQAHQDILRWLGRLEDGQVATLVRGKIVIPLSGEPSDVKRRHAMYGDFTKINNRWYASSSDKTHARLLVNAEEWAHYHTLYREARKSWTVIPFEEEIRWLEQRDPLVVGDFGCGEAIIAERVGDKHDVRSFDHVAFNEKVQACDLAAVPLGDGELDGAIFCLSLMGSNFTDYLREAHRCLRLDGWLHIWESANYFDDVAAFRQGLAKLGFDVTDPQQHGAFVCIRAIKSTRLANPSVVIPFRGRT